MIKVYQSEGAREFSRSPWKVRYFLDTEFTSFQDCQLISVAVVGENGLEFYGERSDFDRLLCSEFVRCTVLPQLGRAERRSMAVTELGAQLMTWLLTIPLKPKPIMCYDFSGDLDLLHQLLEGPIPRGWGTENVAQKLDPTRLADYFEAHGGRHHALHDARAKEAAFR